MADGTVRVQIDIDPPYRRQFFDNFGEIDMPVALVPMKPGAVMAQPDPTPTPEPKAEAAPKEPAGPLCKLAAIWCSREDFQEWLSVSFAGRWNIAASCDDMAERAAQVIRGVCGVKSRRELDTTGAGHLFDRHIRIPFSAHIKETGNGF